MRGLTSAYAEILRVRPEDVASSLRGQDLDLEGAWRRLWQREIGTPSVGCVERSVRAIDDSV